MRPSLASVISDLTLQPPTNARLRDLSPSPPSFFFGRDSFAIILLRPCPNHPELSESAGALRIHVLSAAVAKSGAIEISRVVNASPTAPRLALMRITSTLGRLPMLAQRAKETRTGYNLLHLLVSQVIMSPNGDRRPLAKYMALCPRLGFSVMGTG